MRGTTPEARSLLAAWVAVRRGDLDPVTFADQICTRIESVDTDLQAFVDEPERRKRMAAEAGELLRRWPDPRDRPPLFGVPLGVKDVVHVDGLPTGAGARLPVDVLAAPDAAEAPVVASLREAGALVVGKTVTAEFAYMAPGPTRNPHGPAHTPGGSSSGSAAAVAAGLVTLAIGTQTVGSVIRPAAFCGVVGFKPTYGRIPTAGVIANAPSFDTVGLLSHDVATAATAAAVVCADWRTRAGSASVARPVLGVPEGPYLDQATPEARQCFAGQVEQLQDAGFTVRRVPALADLADVISRNDLINLVELARSHETWFQAYEDLYREQSATAIREGRRISAQAYERALTQRKAYAAALVAQMDAEGIDAWIAPAATGPAPEGLDTTGSPLMNLPWTQARLPVVGVPAGTAGDGLPLGVQVAARPHADEELVSWAVDLEATLATSTSP